MLYPPPFDNPPTRRFGARQDSLSGKSGGNAFQKGLLLPFTIKSMPSNLLQRITINPDICHGKPTVRNMRYPVSMILDLLSAGMTADEILADYPALEKEDIQACLRYASLLSETKTIHKLSA